MADELRFEDSQRHVRAFKEGRAVVDSKRGRLVYGLSPYPVYAFPPEDVVLDEVTLAHRGEGWVVPEWEDDQTWMEEDEVVYAHPCDPHHRVDTRRSSRHVVVRVADVTVADSHSPVLLFETGLPVRYYLPRTHIRMELLRPSDRVSWCPYKGRATYWSVVTGDRTKRDVVWAYDHPLEDCSAIAGLLAFWNERVTLIVDDEEV